MWIFTKEGFFSAVEKRDAAAKLVVRARSRADIDALADIIDSKRLEQLS